MKKFRFAGLILAVVMLFGLFGGCTLRDPLDIDAEMQKIIDRIDFKADSSHTGKLRIYAQSKPTELLAINAFVDSFKLKYPNIEVDLKTFVADSYIDTIKKEHSAADSSQKYDEMADVFWLTNETIPSLVNMEMIAPISYIDLVDDSFSTDALVDSMVRDSMFGGQMYMMPRDYNQFVMFYNKWLFEKCGVDEIDNVEALSAEELEGLMYRLHGIMASNKFTTPYGGNTGEGQVIDCNWAWGSVAYGLYRMFGADVVDNEGNVIFGNGDATYNAIEWVKKSVYNGYTPEPGEQSSGGFFTQYKAPFLIETRAVLTDLIKSDSKNNWAEHIGVAPMPELSTSENYSVGAGCSGYGMYQHVTNATEAWLFLKHVVSVEGQEAFGKTGNSVPVLESLLEKEDAAWRHPEADLPDDFNHDAFIYKYKDKSCVMSDFKSKIPAKSVARVAAVMQSTLTSSVNQTPATGYEARIKKNISDSVKTMEKEIAKYR